MTNYTKHNGYADKEVPRLIKDHSHTKFYESVMKSFGKEQSSSQERAADQKLWIAPYEDSNQPSAIQKLTSGFSQPTNSNEAIAINSICMILKTLQPKRKDGIPNGTAKGIKEEQLLK